MTDKRTIAPSKLEYILRWRWIMTAMLILIPAMAFAWWGRSTYPESFPPLIEELDRQAWASGAQTLFPDRYEQFHHNIGQLRTRWRMEINRWWPEDTAEEFNKRGIPLRTFQLREAGWIGDVFTHPTVIRLTSKDPLISPLPIVPPQDSSSSSPTEEPAVPLTVTDMPLRFELTSQENLTVLVQPSHLQGFWINMVDQIAGWSQRVAANVGTWAKSKQYLVMSLDPAEAQALYWATIPPMDCLIITGLASGG